MISPKKPKGKRKRAEIADSQSDDGAGAGNLGEDEDDYGWVEESDDEAVRSAGVEVESPTIGVEDPAED